MTTLPPGFIAAFEQARAETDDLLPQVIALLQRLEALEEAFNRLVPDGDDWLSGEDSWQELWAEVGGGHVDDALGRLGQMLVARGDAHPV